MASPACLVFSGPHLRLCAVALFVFLLADTALPRDGGAARSLPGSMTCSVQPYYKYRADRKPGRAVLLRFTDGTLPGPITVDVQAGAVTERITPPIPHGGTDSLEILLPPEVGVTAAERVMVGVRTNGRTLEQTVDVPPMRHWRVFVYPHSHVDIGYSNTHANVEFIHRRNIDRGIALAGQTRSYPAGARYLWNTEVMWPFERAYHAAEEDERKHLLRAVKNGSLCLDAAYVHILTSGASEEEMFQSLRPRREVVARTGAPIDTYVQVDIPGLAWGMVPVLAHEGVRYIMMMPNGTRGNDSLVSALRQRPLWWEGPDGRSRVLFLNAGTYAVGLAKGRTTGRPWFGQRDRDKIPLEVRTEDPRQHFLDRHLFRELPLLEAAGHPYDLFVVTWAMWDNALLDADLPDAVRSWNAEYAYPRLEIAGAHTIMSAFERQYGDRFPVVRGDFTEYWTDGFGTLARETKTARNARDRMVQAEILWSMLRPGQPAPREAFDEAWRNVVLCTEHTFTYENPTEPYFQDAIWRMKQRYYQEAEDRSRLLLDEALAPATDKSDGALGPGAGPANGGIAVFNTNSWPHGGLVTLSAAESQTGNRVVDDRGNEVLAQRLTTGELVFLAPDIPPFGSRHFRVVAGSCSLRSPVRWDRLHMDNGMVEVTIDERTGTIVRLFERSSGRDYADPGIDGGINSFRWQPGKGDGDAAPDSVLTITLAEAGPLLGEVRIVSRAPGCRSLVRTIRLAAGQSSVTVANTVDKLPLLPKDGVHFGFAFRVPGGTTRVDIPWGVMELQKDQWPAANRAWMTTQHFADISNDSAGVTWCSLDAPLMESGAITANNTASWDGAGDIWPSTYAPATVLYSWVMNNHWFTNTPLTQDGPVTFRYALRPHGRFDAGAAYRFGREHMQPLVALATGRNPIAQPIVATGGSRVATTMLKAMGTGTATIIRLRSLSDTPELVPLSWPLRTPRSVRVCDRGEEPGPVDAMRAVAVPARGLVTLRVEW